MEAVHELELLVRSGHPLIAVDTFEEERLESALAEIARSRGLLFQTWNAADGLRRHGDGSRVHDGREPDRALRGIPALTVDGLWLFKDLHRFVDRPEVVRALRELAGLRGAPRRTVVMSAPAWTLPPLLEKAAVRFRLALPEDGELRRLVHEVVNDLGRLHRVRVDLDDDAYQRLVTNLKGMTLLEAERAVTRAVLDDLALDASDVAFVQRAKREELAKGGVLEYVPPRPNAVALGGLGAFRRWIEQRSNALTPEAAAFGLSPPKGIVLLGVQGCGKSMAARMVAERWDLPLLRLEPGRLYDLYVGESEKNLEQAIQLAEHMAPCVLLIDEIEKGFAGMGGAAADGGLSRRIFGRLLGWLQERAAAVFVVATCNAVDEVPPELLRKGRFDEVFFVDLPEADERREILALHLEARKRKSAAFDLDGLAAASEGFSGAELEQAVVAALHTAFAAGRDLDTEVLREELGSTRPLSVLRREDIERLRAWAAGRTVSAR